MNEGRLLREWAKKCVQQIYLHLVLSSFQYISVCGSRCRSITHECDCTRKPDVECKTSLYEMTWNQVLCRFCCWILRCRVCVCQCVCTYVLCVSPKSITFLRKIVCLCEIIETHNMNQSICISVSFWFPYKLLGSSDNSSMKGIIIIAMLVCWRFIYLCRKSVKYILNETLRLVWGFVFLSSIEYN